MRPDPKMDVHTDSITDRKVLEMKLIKTIFVLTIASTFAMQSVMADEAASKNTVAPAILDVELGENGRLSGYLVNAEGKAIVGEEIQILQGKKLIAQTKSGDKGEYSVKGLRGGTYRVASKSGSAYYRLWQNGTAPKSAQKFALVVANQGTVVRGQLGDVGGLPLLDGISTLNLIAGATVVGLGIANYSETQDNSDELAKLRQQLANTAN